LVSSIKGGKVRFKDGDPSGVVIEIIDNKITSRSTETGKIVGRSIFKADTSKEPFEYKLTPQTDILAGIEFKGLCKVENDKLTLCTSVDPADDLSKFTSSQNTMISISVYSRVK
jgi:hypothetical protein